MMKQSVENLCTLVRGSSPRPSGDSRYYGGDIPRLMVRDVSRDGMYVTPQIDFLTEEGAARSRAMKKGDLVIAVSGDPGEPSILNVDACIHDGFVGLKELKTESVFTPYLYRYFKFNKEQSKSQAVGAIYKNLNTAQIKALQIPLPPLDQQKKIAAILDTADTYRQKTKELITKYDELTQSLFLDMFGDPVRNPMNWEKIKLGDLHKITSGGTPSRKNPEYFLNGTIPWVKTGELKGVYASEPSEFITNEALNNSSAKLFPKNTLLIAMYGATIGACSILNFEACTNQACGALLPCDKVNVFFEYFFFKMFKNELIKMGVGGAQPNISAGILKNISIYFPPIILQNLFAERAKAIEVQKSQAQASLIQAENLFNSLLQKAFKGELV